MKRAGSDKNLKAATLLRKIFGVLFYVDENQLFIMFLPSSPLACGREPGRARVLNTQTKLPTACLSNIQFPYVNVDALRDGAVGVPLLIKSPVHHVNPLTEANAIDLSLVALPSFFYMQRLAIDNPSSRCGSTTIVKLDSIQRCGGPVSLYAGCLYNVEQLRPLLFSSKMKERKKKGVFLIFFFFSLNKRANRPTRKDGLPRTGLSRRKLRVAYSETRQRCAMRDVICLTCCSFIEMTVEEEDALIHHESVGEIPFSL